MLYSLFYQIVHSYLIIFVHSYFTVYKQTTKSRRIYSSEEVYVMYTERSAEQSKLKWNSYGESPCQTRRK